ncbi:MAG: DNA adenine methylase [Culicoidibacterales bacterium]
MVYLGSKNRISKYLKPIIESYITEEINVYVEPFVGGANMIDKIDFHTKIGYDNNKYLIALLKQAQSDMSVFPETISEEEYKKVKNEKDSYEDWYVALVGFCASFGSKWFGGYARVHKNNHGLIDLCVISGIKNLKKQAPNLKNIIFNSESYDSIQYEDVPKMLIYCDPPYAGTTKYHNVFDHEKFYEWCKNVTQHGHTILISEYNMPDEFTCIWEKEHSCKINGKNMKNTKRTEKLYTIEVEK